MKFFSPFLLLLSLSSVSTAEDFITLKEYAKMLYENPRGISCKLCHGEDGSSQKLSLYKQKGQIKEFIVPDIREISFKEFEKSLKEVKDTKSIMPTYSLTSDEIMILYSYIQGLKKEKK